MYAQGTVTASYSDKRLKTNIAPIDNSISKINAMRGIEYNWNDLAKKLGYQAQIKQVGLIAQEVQKQLPEVVPLKEVVDGVEYYTIHYERLVPLAVQAIKEQQQHIFRIIDKMSAKGLLGQTFDHSKFNYRNEI
jgi:hypothetical protein